MTDANPAAPASPDATVAALEAAIDAWLADAQVLFDSEGARKRAFHDSIRRRDKAWSKPSTCMYRGCGQPTIRHSHSLQRAHALARIAEDGHVLTPGVDTQGRIFMDRIGLGHASTFPGFCKAHERLFSEFEDTGEIETVRHGVLQAFRTVCREISRRRHILEHIEKERRAHIARRTAYLRKAVLEATGRDDASPVRLEGDPSEQPIDEAVARTVRTLRELDRLYDALLPEIETRPGEGEATILRVPFRPPVALSGIVLIDHLKRSARTRTATCAIGVVPQRDGCVVFVATLRHHRQFIKAWERKLQSGLTMLDLLEGWMTHGTDHWFITPSAWAAIGEERQRRILAELQSLDGVPSADPAEPILDEIRRVFVEALRRQIAEGDTSDALANFLSLQQAKLPFRGQG